MHHVMSNCNREYRCVKCNNKYNQEESVLQNKGKKKETAPNLYRVNCGSFGHPALYRVSETETNATENQREKNTYKRKQIQKSKLKNCNESPIL